MKLSAFLSLTLIVGLAGALTLSAQSIPLANAGFETPTVAVGTNNGGGIPGWQFSQNTQKCSDGTFSTAGVAHPLSSQLAPPSDGSQVGYSHFCGPYSTTAIWQTLPVNYSPNTGYTFTLDFYRDAAINQPLQAAIGFCYGHSTDPADSTARRRSSRPFHQAAARLARTCSSPAMIDSSEALSR